MFLQVYTWFSTNWHYVLTVKLEVFHLKSIHRKANIVKLWPRSAISWDISFSSLTSAESCSSQVKVLLAWAGSDNAWLSSSNVNPKYFILKFSLRCEDQFCDSQLKTSSARKAEILSFIEEQILSWRKYKLTSLPWDVTSITYNQCQLSENLDRLACLSHPFASGRSDMLALQQPCCGWGAHSWHLEILWDLRAMKVICWSLCNL